MSDFDRRPRLARGEIGVTRFVRGSAVLKPPYLELSQKFNGGIFFVYAVLERHPEQAVHANRLTLVVVTSNVLGCSS